MDREAAFRFLLAEPDPVSAGNKKKNTAGPGSADLSRTGPDWKEILAEAPLLWLFLSGFGGFWLSLFRFNGRSFRSSYGTARSLFSASCLRKPVAEERSDTYGSLSGASAALCCFSSCTGLCMGAFAPFWGRRRMLWDSSTPLPIPISRRMRATRPCICCSCLCMRPCRQLFWACI